MQLCQGYGLLDEGRGGQHEGERTAVEGWRPRQRTHALLAPEGGCKTFLRGQRPRPRPAVRPLLFSSSARPGEGGYAGHAAPAAATTMHFHCFH